MHQSAQNQIIDHLSVFEGVVPYMYLDVRGLVTTGIGNLLDPLSTYGRKVRFYRRSDLGFATEAEVKAEFALVKSKCVPGGGAPQRAFAVYTAFEPLTKLRVYPEDIKAAVLVSLAAQETWIRSQLGRDYDLLPADVQVMLVQMGYAGSLKSRLPELGPPLKKRDYLAARQYAFLSNAQFGQKGYGDYNAAFKLMLVNAWIVEQCSLQRMKHWSPQDITEFFGVKRGLQIARWYTQNDVRAEVRTDDSVTVRDYSAWVKMQKLKP